jgi:hypothetical protein
VNEWILKFLKRKSFEFGIYSIIQHTCLILLVWYENYFAVKR